MRCGGGVKVVHLSDIDTADAVVSAAVSHRCLGNAVCSHGHHKIALVSHRRHGNVVFSYGHHGIAVFPTDTTKARWFPTDATGIQYFPTDTTGLRCFPQTPQECGVFLCQTDPLPLHSVSHFIL